MDMIAMSFQVGRMLLTNGTRMQELFDGVRRTYIFFFDFLNEYFDQMSFES